MNRKQATSQCVHALFLWQHSSVYKALVAHGVLGSSKSFRASKKPSSSQGSLKLFFPMLLIPFVHL